MWTAALLRLNRWIAGTLVGLITGPTEVRPEALLTQLPVLLIGGELDQTILL